MPRAQDEIVQACEDFLARNGDNHNGVGWPNADDAQRRYAVMLDLVKPTGAARPTLLDFGCGAGHLYEYMLANGYSEIAYSGLDLSPRFRSLVEGKHKGLQVYGADILSGRDLPPAHDYVIANGVFTMKCGLSFDEMWDYVQRMLVALFSLARAGVAFNVMSKHVDWERDDLFHVPHDLLAEFLVKRLTRNFVMRNDYGLYEYTTYIYR